MLKPLVLQLVSPAKDAVIGSQGLPRVWGRKVGTRGLHVWHPSLSGNFQKPPPSQVTASSQQWGMGSKDSTSDVLSNLPGRWSILFSISPSHEFIQAASKDPLLSILLEAVACPSS